MRHPWFTASAPDGRDLAEELLSFAEIIGLEKLAARRYSLLLLLGLYGGASSGRLNPAKIVQEIAVLEGDSRQSKLKPASTFNHEPLKGLWHKHYLEDGLPALARNLRKGIGRFGIPFLQEQVNQAASTGEDRYLTQEDCARIAHDAVIGNFERLIEESALTGEWIIFAEWQGQKYYLCLSTHKTGDRSLRAQIDTVCLLEFPFLSQILSANAES